MKTVFVSGVFDALHPGHIAFLQEAASYGTLHVGIGSDSTVLSLKGRKPIYTEDERVYVLESLSCVFKVSINPGSGMLDFSDTLTILKPDIFIVNEDGHTQEKADLCTSLKIEYKVLKRTPHNSLPVRSTTSLRPHVEMPYRLDLAGGWLDQPFVSKLYPGWVITASLEPSTAFSERSGMATSTRNKALELWGQRLPQTNPERVAKCLFEYDDDISGSQDSIGIVVPGVNRSYYPKGKRWPNKVEHLSDPKSIQWLESLVYLIPLWPRPDDFNVMADSNISLMGAEELASAANTVWDGLVERDVKTLARGVARSFESQVSMFPRMVDDKITRVIHDHKDKALAWKLSGAGGGGYLTLISEVEIPNAIRIKIRLPEDPL